jgi:hypothetical protein
VPAANIVDLRKFLAERFPQGRVATNSRLRTGLDLLDEVSGGGLPKGMITELISPQISAGSASLIHALIRLAERDRYFVALVDGEDSFDPQALEAGCLGHLLWVRCFKAMEAIKAADLLLRDGNFALVIVDLIFNPATELRQIPQTNWYRLQRLVESAATACLVLTRHSLVSSAQLKIVLENSWTLQTLESAISALRFHVQRSHLKSEINDRMSEVS